MAKDTIKKQVANKNTTAKPGVTKKDGTITEGGLLIQNIIIRALERNLIDIQKWRSYMKAAEGINGTRRALYDLYSDVLLDGFLKRLVAKRILGVTKNKIKYVDASGAEVETAKAFINLRQFRKLRQAIQKQKAWGIAVIELMNVDGEFKIYDVNKKHIRPAEGLITEEQLGQDGISYRDAPYSRTVLEVGEYDDLGYLLEAAAYAIYKRGNIADWANYAQIFGMPFRVARYDGFNEQVRLQLENAMEKAASAAYAVLPKEALIEFLESKSATGSNTLYSDLRKAMNEEMTVLIIGATETTTSSASSGYAQSETHLKTVDELADDDKQDELAILNEKVLTILINLGFIPAGGRFIYDEPLDIEEANDRLDMAAKLIKMGAPIDDEYLYEISGIPKPKNYDAMKKQMADDKAAAAASSAPPTAFPKNKPGGTKKPQKLTADQQIIYNEIQEKLLSFFE